MLGKERVEKSGKKPIVPEVEEWGKKGELQGGFCMESKLFEREKKMFRGLKATHENDKKKIGEARHFGGE